MKQLAITISKKRITKIRDFFEKYVLLMIVAALAGFSVWYFYQYLTNGLGLAYNDARSHLDIGRRVVEGLKPGLAQLGSVWLPLPHILMIPTIWNDFFWHSGLSGALQSMISFIATGALIYIIMKRFAFSMLSRVVAVVIFAANLNILYLQSTAMTELLLIATLTTAIHYFIEFHRNDNLLALIKSALFVMLATLIRYEGWFLLVYGSMILGIYVLKTKGYKAAEGTLVLFGTLAGLGIVMWLLWNQLIFKDALYFAFGPFSAHAQQQQLESAGVLATKGDLLLSLKIYLYALIFNSGAYVVIAATLGALCFWFDKNIKWSVRLASTTLLAPFIFNVLALYLGHSVLFIQGISGNTWFNVRYGIIMAPTFAIFIGYLIHRFSNLRFVIIGFFLLITIFSFANRDAVTIDDARVGSSQKNVSEVSGWLATHTRNEKGFVLISAASHDAIIFSSGLPMKKFIHEGTGAYWESATLTPDRWARWVIMRTHDDNDLTWKAVKVAPGFAYYDKVASFPFADIYELKPEYLEGLNTDAVLGKQK